MFEWDPDKAARNRAVHGVDFPDAILVLEDDRAITVVEDSEDGERFVTVGMDALGRVLVVVYTWRRGRIRVISARRATRREMAQYEER